MLKSRCANFGAPGLISAISADIYSRILFPIFQVLCPDLSRFQWRFQKFSVDDRRSGVKSVSPHLGSGNRSIRGRLSQPPKVSRSLQGVLPVSTGTGELRDMDKRVVDSGILSTLKAVLPELGYDMIKDAAEDIVVEGDI